MLKFVHTKPPRARSSSPASPPAASSLDHPATATRPRDRSFPHYPPVHPAQRHQDRPYPPPLRTPSPQPSSFQERSYSPSPPFQFSHDDRSQPPYPFPSQSRPPRAEVATHRPPPHHARVERSGRESPGFGPESGQRVAGPVRIDSDYDQLRVPSPHAHSDRGRGLHVGVVRTPSYGIPPQGPRGLEADYSQAELARTPVVRDRERARVLFPPDSSEEHVGRFPVIEEEEGVGRPQAIPQGQILVSDRHGPPRPDVPATVHRSVREDVGTVRRPEPPGSEGHVLWDRPPLPALRRHPSAERHRTESAGLGLWSVREGDLSRQPSVGHPFPQTHQPRETHHHLSHSSPVHVTGADVDLYFSKPGKFPVTDSDRESSKASSVRERHVRIAPHPAEIYIGSRDSHSSVTDRGDSPSVKSLHSILSKHPKDRDHRIRSSSSSRDETDLAVVTPSGLSDVRQTREGQTSGNVQSRTSAEPSVRTTDSRRSPSFHEKPGKKAAREEEEEKGREGGKKGKKAGKGKKEGGGGGDKGWKPKLLFSGSWLHGPSRHRIFASKRAQPQPQPAVMTTCVPQVSNDLSNEALNKAQTDRSVTQSSQGSRGIMSSIKDMLNRSQDNVEDLYLDLTYITERIISMWFPSEGHDTTYAFNLKDVVRMLKTKHGDNYLVLNLSEKRQDLVKANPQVKDYGWPDHLAPPLERLCSVCKAMDAWLHADPRNVAVLHCKGGRARLAIIIAAYMHYSNICASADQALDRFAMKRFYEDKLGGLPLPSQRRYVHYFSGLLSGAIKINSNPLYLHHILIHGVPNFDAQGGCRPFIKVYQGMQPIFTSGVYNVTDNMQKVCISISPGIPLRGDILIKCYHKKGRHGSTGGGGSAGREIIWQCQFHTCAIQDGNIVFSKQELDDGIHDPRFPDNGKVEFVFGPTSDVPVSVSGFKSDVTVPVDDNEDSLTRSDSYENFHRTGQGVDRYVGPRDVSYGSQQQAELHSSTYTTQVNSARTNYNTSSVSRTAAPVLEDHYNYNSVPRQQTSAPPVEERSQLDDLLSDLLSDQVIVTSPTSPRSPSSPQQNMMKGAKTVTTTTHTYHTFSSTDSHGGRSPADKVLIQRAEVTYKVPGVGEERQHYTIAGEPPELEKPRRPAEDAFSYSSTSSSHVDQSRRFQSLERDMNRSERVINVQHSPPARTQTLPYRADYENRYNVSESQQHYNTMDADQASWLQQQQQKLQRKRDGRDASGRTDQEKQLVSELKFAQNRYYNQREVDDKAAMDSYRQQPMHNGPLSASTLPANYAPPPRGFGGDSGHFSTYSQSQSQFTESHYTSGDRSSNKPPPSPTLQRLGPPTSMPVQPPARSSSKDYMRSRSHSSSSNLWQTSPPANRPLERQYSETLLDRDHMSGLQAPRRAASTTPPMSPPGARSPVPMGPTATTTYTTYRTIHKEVRDDPIVQPQVQQAVAAPPVQAPPPQPQHPPANQQTQHNYITEVFVHRVGGEKQAQDKPDSIDDTRLDELTRSLQAATESLMEDRVSSKQQQKHQQSYQQSSSWQEHYQSVSNVHARQAEPRGAYGGSMSSSSEPARSRSASSDWDNPPIYSQVQKTQKEQGPPPKAVNVIEEDRITLRPIGPGMQTLEPEGSHSSSTLTLNRAATPSFPTSPGGPMSTQTYSQQQQQFHQQYQQHGHVNDGTLHIDTSHRMLSPNQARSPSSAGSPHSPGNIHTLRQELSAAHTMSGGVVHPQSLTGQSSPSVYFGLSRRGSLSSIADSDMVHATPKFVKDTSKYWYKPNITRDDAIALLRDKPPGTFVIRDSNTFPGAYGLALKVAQLPPNVQPKHTNDPQSELVRHFLIEPTPKGVRLRGCSNEPVFGSLAALVYQHSITPLALPCKLNLPDLGGVDMVDMSGAISPEVVSHTEVSVSPDLLAKGAACNVIFINSVDTESLTGPQAIAKAIQTTIDSQPTLKTTVVHFKVSNQGITLTDNNRKLFFRRHYPVSAVTYCGMDPQDRRWKRDVENPNLQMDAKIFGFVARKQGGGLDNSCHLFAELDPEQPASAIVNFITKVMIGQIKVKS